MRKSIRSPRLSGVRLLEGSPFYDRQQDMNSFLLSQDTDTLLYNFRKAAGLPLRGASPMTGWDADECKLKGHTTGHYLSAVSLAYAATGDERFLEKAEQIAEGFRECRDAFTASGKVRPGFLSAYDEEQFDLLEKFTKYPDIWAPYYTLDKIMSGLLDAYELAGCKGASDILSPLGDWVSSRLSALPDEMRHRMWSMYIAGEYGGMISTMIRLYRITGKASHLEAARLFENDHLFDMMAEGRDGLSGMHANQHIPQIIGALELYDVTGDQRYLDIAVNFHRIVTGHHCYVIGGTGEQEKFCDADSECRYLTDKSAESCASYNMLKLTAGLFRYTETFRLKASELMDYYERTLFNHILMSASHRPDGGTTYFLPLAPGSAKHYETEENSCCHGTGMESRYRFMTDIFSYCDEEGLLLINLPVSSQLRDEEAVSIRFSENGTLTVRADSDMKRRIAVRIPTWAGDPQTILSDMTAPDKASVCTDPDGLTGGYLILGRALRTGEEITLRLPLTLRTVSIPSDPDYMCLAWGPYLLGALSASDTPLRLPAGILSGRDGSHGVQGVGSPGRQAGTASGEFTFEEKKIGADRRISAEKIRLIPLYRIDEEKYQVYFRRQPKQC